GASQAGIQQGATDGALHGLDLFNNKDTPDLATPPPRTESDSSTARGTEAPWNGNGRPPSESGSERWDDGPDRDNRGGENQEDRENPGAGRDREDTGRPDVPPATATDGTGDHDDFSDIDDVPDLVSDTGSDTGSDTDFDFGDPDPTPDDTVRVHDDADTRTPDTDKAPFEAADTKPPGLDNDPYLPGMNDGPLTVNFLNAIVPDNPLATPPPGTDQTTPNTGDNHNDNPANTNPVDRTAPEPQQQDTTAPLTVAPPLSQATPPPTGPQPPATAPNNPTTGNTTGQDTPSRPTDDQQADPDTARPHEPPPQPIGTPPPPPPVTESGGDRHVADPTTGSGPSQDAEDTGHNPPEHDREQPDGRDEATSRDGDGSQESDKDPSGDGRDRSGEQSGDRSGDEKGPGDDRERRSGDEDDAASGRENDGEGRPTDDDAESVREEDSDGEGDRQEQNGEETPENAPAGTSVPQGRESTPDRPSDEESAEVVRTAVTTGSETPVLTEETRSEDRDREESAPPPPSDPVLTDEYAVEPAEAPADTDAADAEHPPPPPQTPDATTDTTATTETDSPPALPQPQSLPQPQNTAPPTVTGTTQRQEEPPPRVYPGSVTPDRAGAPYDIGYLLTSSLVNSSMIHAEHLRSFVNDTLTDNAGRVDAAARDAVREQVDEQARKQMGVFFRPEGFSTTVTGADGSRWQADVRLNASPDGFHHAPTQPERGSSTELKLVDEAGEANPAEGGGNHGGSKFVGAGFQVSPLLLGTVSGTDLGPRFTVSFSGGTRQRQTGETTARIHDGYTSYEIKGKPEVYASDLSMSFDLTPLPGPGDAPARDSGPAGDNGPSDGNTSTDGTPPANDDAPADRGVNARSESPDGVVLVLPGEVVANAGPEAIRLRDPFATEDHQRGRDDARPAGPHTDKGHPVWVGDIRPSDGSSDKPFTDWVADHLWSPERDRGWWRPVVDKVTPGFVDKRRQQKLDAFHDQVGETFSERSVRNNLPKMTSAPAVFTVTDPSGTPRLVSIQSVPTSYDAKPHTIQPAKYIKGNKAEREVGTSLRHHDFLGATLGAGVSADAGTPGGTHKVRVDAIAVEGGMRGRATEESTRSSSGSANRINYGKTESSAYDVQRNYYVHFDGEPTVYRFQGDTVEILTVQEARILNGDEASDKVPVPPAPVRTEGNTTAPPAVNTPGTAPDTTGDQRTENEGGENGRNTEGRTEGGRPRGDRSGEQRSRNEGAGAPRPPRPNLAEDQPVALHGSVPRDFTWPDGNQYRDVDGQQRSIYQQIAHEVLTGLAAKRPGLVLPELARDPKNFARRPGHEATGPFTGSAREHRPFRRDHDVAVFNTHRVMDAISASAFKSGTDDLTLHGQPIHLIETGRFDPSALFKPGKDVLRPPFVAVRVTADFSSLRHVGETTRGTGGEYSGASERTTGDGSQTRKTVRVTSGAYVRRIDTVDAADNPSDGGVFSVSGQLNTTRGSGRGLGVKSQSDEIVQYAEDSSVWNSTVRFSAKLYENDDLGMVLGDDRTRADRGHDLLDAPVQALATMDTAKATPGGETGDRNGAAPQATRIRPIPVAQAKEMIDGHTAPTPNSVRKRRDVTGTVTRWFGGGQERRPPAGRAPVPAPDRQETTGDVRTPPTTETTDNTGTNGQQNTEAAPPPNTTQNTSGQQDTGSRTGDIRTPPTTETTGATGRQNTETAPPPNTTTTHNTTGQRDTTGNTPDNRTPEQRRAALIRNLGPTVEHVNTRFTTDDDNRVGSLLDASYENFSSVPRWERGDGVQRTPGRFGFERKLRHFLVRGQGSRQFYENALSPENLAGNPALQSSGGARTRTEMSGGLLSPHHVRATTATQFDIDSVDRFEQSDGAIVWKDKNTLEVFTREGRRTDVTLLATGGGRFNPNPVQSAGQPSGGAERAPDSAGAPLIQLGPSAGKSLFDRYTNTRPTSKFSETVEFHPKIPMSYSFSASGRVTQAVEFAKNWSIGPTIPRAARYRGWQAHVRDLVTGLVHIRDAHQSGLVEDKVEETDGGLVRVPQPEPDRPASVRPRPGFEDAGKMIRPSDPDEALQSLADDLASQGWQLTKDSRETILHALNSHTGLNPNTGTPVTVKVSPIDHSIGNLNAPTTAPLSLDATVNLRLDRGDTEVAYLGGKTEYRQRQGWEDGDKFQQGSEGSSSAGVQGSLLTPLPRSGGDQPGGATPSSRPYLMGTYGNASAANAHGGGGTSRNTDKRSVGLTMETPYARVSSDTRLTIDLHISDKQGVANTLTAETPGSGGRRDFTGAGDSGRVEALYPTPYLDLTESGSTADRTDTTATTGEGGGTTRPTTDGTGTGGTTTTGPTGGSNPRTTGADTPADHSTTGTTGGSDPRTTGDARRTEGRPSPENPSNDHHASLPDMMRTWSQTKDPGGRSDFRDAVVMPAAVENNGKDVRDLGHVVVAKSLGWNPPANSVSDGNYTPRAVRQAAEYAAGKLGLNSRNNAIDQSLNAIALKALFSEANAESGAELIEMGRTTWGVRAAPRPESARILDFNPSVRLTDSSESSTTFSPFHSESSTTTMGFDARPSGRTGTGLPTTATHYGSADNTGSSTSGGDTARGSKPKEPPHSDRVRTGPAYLVEIDTDWAIGVRSELRGPWYKRSARYVGDTTAAAGRYTVAKVRGVFGDRRAPAAEPSRPARWQRGETSAKITTWVSHGDAVRLGIITPDVADRIAPLTTRFADIQKQLGDAEKAYLEARLPLDGATTERITSPDDPRVRQRYTDLETTYEDRLEDLNAAEHAWETALRELRDGLNAPSSLPRPRTVSPPSLDTIQEEPPPPQTNAPDPAADPEAIELPERGNRPPGGGDRAPEGNTGRQNPAPGLLDTLGSDLDIRPREAGEEEAPAPSKAEKLRLARWRLDQMTSLGPPVSETGGSSRYDTDLIVHRPEEHSFQRSETGHRPGPFTAEDAVFDFGEQRFPGSEEWEPDYYGPDLRLPQETGSETSSITSDDLREMRLRLERLMSTSPSPSDGDGPPPTGADPAIAQGEQDFTAPVGAGPDRDGLPRGGTHTQPSPPASEETSGTGPQPLPRNEDEEGSPPLPLPREGVPRPLSQDDGNATPQENPRSGNEGPPHEGRAPQHEGPPPREEQPSPLSDPAFDLAALFDHALNGSMHQGGGGSGQNTDTTTPAPAPATTTRDQRSDQDRTDPRPEETDRHRPAPPSPVTGQRSTGSEKVPRPVAPAPERKAPADNSPDSRTTPPAPEENRPAPEEKTPSPEEKAPGGEDRRGTPPRHEQTHNTPLRESPAQETAGTSSVEETTAAPVPTVDDAARQTPTPAAAPGESGSDPTREEDGEPAEDKYEAEDGTGGGSSSGGDRSGGDGNERGGDRSDTGRGSEGDGEDRGTDEADGHSSREDDPGDHGTHDSGDQDQRGSDTGSVPDPVPGDDMFPNDSPGAPPQDRP
ncbi:hypothetical protein Q8791_25690, partial [Nocardiopsis sp. CT-R113]